MKKRILLFALLVAFSAQLLHAQESAPSSLPQPCLTDGQCVPNPKPASTPPDPMPTRVLPHGVLWISPNKASGASKVQGSVPLAFSQPCLQDSGDGDCGDPTLPPPPPPPLPHLAYFGGPVISNVQVVEVLYGSGSFLPQVSSTITPSIASFFNDILGANSGYINLLTQYNTPAFGGTNQTIGNGTFYGLFQIVPSAANNGSTITDTQIQAELLAQINAGHLPSPILDAAGNVNTLYMIYFPPGQKITLGQLSSCVSGGFCAYHGTTSNTLNSKHLLYGVLPDMQAGSGCDTGCGPSTTFGNYTSVTSHELTEAITDADAGLVTTAAFPRAWVDVNYGEIGDICNAEQGLYQANGTTYTIQLEFSNAADDCVLPPPVFSLSSSPANLTINQGASGSSTITVTPFGGFTGSVTLSVVSGLPSGVTAIFSTNPATSTSVVTFAASATATPGPATVSIQGISGALPPRFTPVSLTVNVPTPFVSLTPSSLTFPDTILGSASAPQFVTLTNTGSAPLLINGKLISSDFKESDNCQSSLAPNTSCTFTVTFTPTVAGAHPNSNLSITDNAVGSPHQVAVSGNGVAPNPVFSPTTLAFGNQTVGTTSPIKTVTLSNSGTAPLLISSPIGIGGDFSQTNNCPTSLAVNAQCTFSVTFTPTTAGQQSNALSITDNATGSPHQVSLSGNGVVPVPILAFLPLALTFANQIVETTSPAQTVVLTNIGSAPLLISAVSISNDFTQGNNCPSSLAPNTSCIFNVTFTPTFTGAHSNSNLSITDNAAGSPHQVPLSGTGLPLVPVLNTIAPSVVTTGSSNFTLVVTGSGFAGNAVVQVNGSQRPTTFINFTQLNAAIPASDLTGSQPLNITVFNPLPSAATSATVPLTLTNAPIPLISNITPPRVEVCNPLPQVVPCNPSVKVIVNGSFFPANPVVEIDSNSLATNFISANQLTATIPAADLTTSRMAQIQVVSSTGGPSSNQVPLAVFRYGDLTFDNLISVSDLSVLENIIAGNITMFDHAAADVFLNGAIDVQDLVTLENYIAGNIHTLPIIPDQTAFLFNAGATVTLSPPMFADQTVGTASDPLPLTLTNGGPTPLSISNIGIPSGDFTQSNNCGNFLAANASCIINVIFSPTASGSRTGTLTVQDNSINGPHVAVLSGNGIAAQ